MSFPPTRHLTFRGHSKTRNSRFKIQELCHIGVKYVTEILDPDFSMQSRQKKKACNLTVLNLVEQTHGLSDINAG